MKFVIFLYYFLTIFFKKTYQNQIVIEEINHKKRNLFSPDKKAKDFVGKVSGMKGLKGEEKDIAEEQEKKNAKLMAKLDNKLTGPFTKYVSAGHALHQLLRHIVNMPQRLVKKGIKKKNHMYNIKYVKITLQGFRQLEQLMNTVYDFQNNLVETLGEAKTDIDVKFTPMIENLEKLKSELKEKIKQLKLSKNYSNQ